MTTTTTTNLNFTKPDIGSEANNWGNLLNSNFDELDKAIAQRLVKGVGGSSDVLLTDSESRFAVIELNGTLGGNISVKTFNDSSRPYIVFNNTSGSYTLTFSTSTGTGVAIPQGQKAIVYSDGTNIVSAVSTDSFSTSKTITMSGDITGSVSTDFSTNPTITTTIASGVIVDADVNSSAGIDATKIANGNVSNTEFQYLDNLTGEIQTQLNSKAASNVTDSLNASNLNSGTIPNARYGTPTFNGSSITSINGSNISSGTVADARISSLTASKLTGALPAIDGSALTGISSVPSSATAVGAIREFQFRATSGNLTSGSVSVGAVITLPYTSGSLGLKDGSDVSFGGTNSGGAFASRGRVEGIGTFGGGSNASFAGSWRCLTSPKAGTFTTGSGNNSVTRGYSLPGLFQRIS